MAKTDLATVDPVQLPAEMVDFGEDAGRGLEDASRNELLTPFLGVLHYQCPQIAEGDDSYVEGARPGMLFNTATRQLSNGRDGVEIVPVHREAIYTEWTPRDEGGGFHGIRTSDDPLVTRLVKEQGRFKRLITPDGTELVEQYNLYLLYNPDGGEITATNAQEAVLAFSSTKIQAYKAFFTLAKAIYYTGKNGIIRPPLWAHRWRLRTLPKKNDQGAFFIYDLALVDPAPTLTSPVNSLVPIKSPLYQRAKEFGDMLAKASAEGRTVADYDNAEAAVGNSDDEIPF